MSLFLSPPGPPLLLLPAVMRLDTSAASGESKVLPTAHFTAKLRRHALQRFGFFLSQTRVARGAVGVYALPLNSAPRFLPEFVAVKKSWHPIN